MSRLVKLAKRLEDDQNRIEDLFDDELQLIKAIRKEVLFEIHDIQKVLDPRVTSVLYTRLEKFRKDILGLLKHTANQQLKTDIDQIAQRTISFITEFKAATAQGLYENDLKLKMSSLNTFLEGVVGLITRDLSSEELKVHQLQEQDRKTV
ncbi:hypothetical protein GOV04_03145 [Candidatus Woesearchaeota archaeon]|nr:hypothetical protein [Candidatus Woesearchaeota archaeon]